MLLAIVPANTLLVQKAGFLEIQMLTRQSGYEDVHMVMLPCSRLAQNTFYLMICMLMRWSGYEDLCMTIPHNPRLAQKAGYLT